MINYCAPKTVLVYLCGLNNYFIVVLISIVQIKKNYQKHVISKLIVHHFLFKIIILQVDNWLIFIFYVPNELFKKLK